MDNYLLLCQKWTILFACMFFLLMLFALCTCGRCFIQVLRLHLDLLDSEKASVQSSVLSTIQKSELMSLRSALFMGAVVVIGIGVLHYLKRSEWGSIFSAISSSLCANSWDVTKWMLVMSGCYTNCIPSRLGSMCDGYTKKNKCCSWLAEKAPRKIEWCLERNSSVLYNYDTII